MGHAGVAVNATQGEVNLGESELSCLIEMFTPLVSRICRSRMSATRGTEVDDAIQDTFVQLLEADRTVIRNLPAWIATVAIHVCARAHRQRYRMQELPLDAAPVPGHGVDPVDVAVDDLWLDAVGARLRSDDETLLRLVYVHQLSYAEVASCLHVSSGHARVLSFRARQRAHAVIEGLR